jgi:hypothetical protein
MTKRKVSTELIGEILPDQIYRTTLSPAIFGYGQQRVIDLVEMGELPVPFPLSPSSRFKAWTGQQIIDHRARMKELAAAQLEIERNRPAQPQSPALTAKIKKMKLRAPSNSGR